ncbi:MAG: UDP-N-acetylmuramoyl-L-alanine--D-glutamate ligase [Clostridia bacterium]|nr:UDP-N-acetylmuramoyl-L-alanine--D-glutamate ligase [Clostridia bacterium]
MAVPSDVSLVYGDGYLQCNEDIIFRSPSVKKRDILTHSPVFCESVYALNKLKCTKICVSGSDGKTTTCSLIYNVLKSKNAFLGGNIGNPIINALDGGYDFTVGELSSFQLLDEDVFCDVAILTNITENHLNYHKDMSEYVGAKENLLKNAKRIILNYDDMTLRNLGKKYKNVEYFSLRSKCDAYVKDGYLCLKGKNLFKVNEIKLKGDFNILNVLATILATYEYATFEEIYQGVCGFYGVSNRLEFVRELNGVSFYNSSIDSTPSRTIASLSAFDIRKCVVILGGSDKNLSYEILGEALKDARYLIVLGENREKIINALSPYTKKIIAVNTLSEGVKTGFNFCKKGDCLILSPASCSFDLYKNYVERGEDFKKAVISL